MTDDIKPTNPKQANQAKPGEELEPAVQTTASAPSPENQADKVPTETAPMQPEQHSSVKAKKDNNTLVAIVLAVLVSLLIIGLGYAALNSSISEVEDVSESNNSSQTEELGTNQTNVEADQEALDKQTFDQELQQLDEDLDGFGDGSEFDDSGLSDENIGL